MILSAGRITLTFRFAGSDSDAKKQAYDAAQSKVHEISNNLDRDASSLKKLTDSLHFGNRGEWKKLENTCIEKDTGELVNIAIFTSKVDLM